MPGNWRRFGACWVSSSCAEGRPASTHGIEAVVFVIIRGDNQASAELGVPGVGAEVRAL